MSWQDDIKYIPFEIITGDKKIWRPLLIPNYQKNVEYNGTQYDFINRAGSYFARLLPKGRSYPLEFAFRGEDNVKISNAFEKSARDTRSWLVTHPFYGKITCQPLSLVANSSGFDSTVMQVQVIETLVANQPTEKPDYSDVIDQKIKSVNDAALIAVKPISGQIPVRNTQHALKITENIAKRVSVITKLESEHKAYQKWYKNAINELNNTTGISSQYLTYMQQLVTMPSTVVSDIGTRFALLGNTLIYLVETTTGVSSLAYFEKLFFNLMGATVISASCKAVSTRSENDFQTKSEVILFINKLSEEYDNYLNNLYNLEDSEFVPDHNLMFSVHALVCDTVALLYQVMFSAKQERIYYTPRDTNLILLAHRLYGIASEENLLSLKSANNISLSEIINIKKDRAIKYYV
jgi:hypothetical protein